MTVSVTFDKSLVGLQVGDTAKATIKIDGQPMTSGTVDWAMDKQGIVKCDRLQTISTPGEVASITALAPGRVDLYCIANKQLSQLIIANAVAKVLTPDRVRDWLQLWLTDFFYTWTPELEAKAAKYYDGFISGDVARHERMKLVNPKLLFMPYTLQYTSIISGNTVQTAYLQILAAWASHNGLSAGDVELMFLHTPDGKRLVVNIWGSNRNLGDPTNPNWIKFQVWRFEQIIAVSPAVTGAFIDEFGSSAVNGNFKLGAGGDPIRLKSIEDAETVLMGMIASAIAPKKLVVNTGSYIFQSDSDIAHAAKGDHLEQINNPMSLDWWNSSWPYMDKLVASSVLTNIVCAYGFGEYESVKDAFSVHMDTQRGKTLELAAYYMIVTDPALLALHLENSWTQPPMHFSFPLVDADIGRPIETRVKTGDVFMRRFTKGLVVVHPIVDRLAPNYGALFSIKLPTDRKYGRVNADGSVAPAFTNVELRRPEAAIFKVIP